MKKIIKEVNEKLGILQVTIADERWYVREKENFVTKLPEFSYVPSVTWICSFYPKGIEYMQWLAKHGWDDAEAIKREAGTKGDKVHQAISAILRGEEVRIDGKFLNKETEQVEELTLEECDAIKSFVDWRNENKPVSLAWDVTVWSDKHNYAGSIDYICKIGDQVYIVDFKTSANVYRGIL